MNMKFWNGTEESIMVGWCQVREGVNTLFAPAGKQPHRSRVSPAVLPDSTNNAGLIRDPFMLAEWNYLDEIVQWLPPLMRKRQNRMAPVAYEQKTRTGGRESDFMAIGWRESMDMVNSFAQAAYEPQDTYVPLPLLQFLPDIKQTGNLPEEPDLSGWQDARVQVNSLSTGWNETREPDLIRSRLSNPLDKGSADRPRSAELNG